MGRTKLSVLIPNILKHKMVIIPLGDQRAAGAARSHFLFILKHKAWLLFH